MSKILITGAGGYIGSVATSLFLEAGHEVVAVDNYVRGFAGPLEFLSKKYGSESLRYYPLDIQTEINSVLDKENGVESVVHYAAFCNVGESEKHPELYFGNNVQTTVALLEGMKKHEIRKILFSSTCSLYGEPKQEFIDETHPVDPFSHPYSESKYISERIILWYGKLFGFKSVFLRYFNVCGAMDDGSIGDSKKPSYHLMQNAVRGGLGIAPFEFNNTEVDTLDKTPIRDYVNVVDLNRAHLLALKYLDTIKEHDLFNLGTGEGNSVLQIVKSVEKILNIEVKKSQGERRKTDVSRAVASNAKIKRVLGWEPTHSLEDSVNSLVKWYQAHPQGWTK
jgi:UDP-glucose 4-epimerase